MLLSWCCLGVALICTIVGLGVDFILSVHGQSYRLGSEISADVGFGHDEIRMTVIYLWDQAEVANRTLVVSYSQAYNDICVEKNLRNENVDSVYCDDLQSLENAGRTIYGFVVFAVVMVAIAALLATIITIARCCCKKPMTVASYFVSGFASSSVVASTVAMFISWNGFSENAAAVLDVVYGYYYPVAHLDTEWDDTKVGPSLVCLYIAIAFGFAAILSIMVFERKKCVGQRNTYPPRHPRGGESPALLEVEGQEAHSENWTIQPYPQNKMDTAV